MNRQIGTSEEATTEGGTTILEGLGTSQEAPSEGRTRILGGSGTSEEAASEGETTDLKSSVSLESAVAPISNPTRFVSRGNSFLICAFFFCILFGLSMIANTYPASEGVWFWYSCSINSGKRLYADLHLALQPLYVLETSGFMAVFGKGWIVSKIPALLHLIAYCLGLLLLIRQSGLSDARRAVLFGCSFFVSVSSVAYTFSDYHVLADCFVLYSLIALLLFAKSHGVYLILALAAVLGMLAGLTITTRLNDGGALFAAVFVALVCLAPAKKLLSLLTYFLGTAFTVLLVVFLSGDSLSDYVHYSILRAARIKGGGGNVLGQAMRLPWNTLEWFTHHDSLLLCVHAVAAAMLLAFLFRIPRQRREWWALAVAIVASAVIAYHLFSIGIFFQNKLLVILCGVLVLLAYLVGFWIVGRLVFWLCRRHRAVEWDRRQILLLIPLALMASGSMSTGGNHRDILEPVGIFIVVAAISCPIRLKSAWSRDATFVLAALLVVCTAANRFNEPYHWHNYLERPMFAGRTWYQHPDYGPMILDKDQLDMILPVCEKIRQSGNDDELLSLPFPGANYFCAIPPWHGYVQTFFDTASRQSIQDLMGELQTGPPKWLLYQQQMTNLRLHENVYNQGQSLPHRDLHKLIEQKIKEGKWRVVYTSDYGTRQQWGDLWDNQWILIQTR